MDFTGDSGGNEFGAAYRFDIGFDIAELALIFRDGLMLPPAGASLAALTRADPARSMILTVILLVICPQSNLPPWKP